MADLVLINGSVWTGDPRRPRAEAVAARAERILKVGTTSEVRALTRGGAEVVDLDGRFVLPGFTDCHTHFLAGGLAQGGLRLRGTANREEFVAQVSAAARDAEPDAWITGGEWDQELFRPVELPRREWIDAVTPANPVFLHRLDAHMALANSLALRLAGITGESAAPPGGEIVRDPGTGRPTGILKDAAMDLVTAKMPAPSFAEKTRAARAALGEAAAHGVTAVHEMADAASFEAFEELDRRNELTVRLSVYFPITEVGLLSRLKIRSPFGSPSLKVAGLKGFVDGSLGSGTAFFFEPYDDNSGTSGLLHEQMFPEGVMEERILEADRAGLQVAIHAIGDRANSVLLDIFERVTAANGPRDRRWRVEHAQHLRPEDISRFGRLGLIASVQPYHAIDDGRWAERKIGRKRAETTYAFRSLADAGAVLAFGSDWTVAPLDPVAGIYAAATRRTLDGRNPGGWVPAQKITVEEAVRAYTGNAAFAGFTERDKGTIEGGKLADLVVLSRDIFRIPAEDIMEAEVRMTIFGGRIIYRK